MSKLKESIIVSGQIELINANGTVVRKSNLVVDSGKNWIATIMSGGSSPMSHIAVGSGTVPPAAADVNLGSEIFRKGVVVSGGTVTDNVVEYEVSLIAGEGTGALTEVGLFNAAGGGVMAARSTFPVYNKGANDVLTIRWTITIG